MESFEIDIDPGQIVRWVMTERKKVPSSLRTNARCITEVKEIPPRREYHLGDEERQDLVEAATIGTLEITPAHERDGWQLIVTVEDEAGPRVTGSGIDAGTEQQIDLGTFYNEFIRPGRGVANVVAEVADPSARRRVTRLLAAIEQNRHPVG